MELYNDLISGRTKLSVVGLGYVGLPLAIAFARHVEVVGFDINSHKVELYRQGVDVTREVGDSAVRQTSAYFACDERELRKASFHIVAVPTPVSPDKTPDLTALKRASEIVGKHLSRGSIVVYESTVYPGATEEVCKPILEEASGLTCGTDFKLGYSPERINPGDTVHRLETIVKIVAGCDDDATETIAAVYGLVVRAGIARVDSIKVAEAAKVIENAQRDINIAFMNELSIIFNKMGLDTLTVLDAAQTKWNFVRFLPGLVGGHCVGVDPYYLTYKAQQLGYHPQVILSGRRINDDMGKYVAENTVKCLIRAKAQIVGARVGVMGITFKENCPDVRNSRVFSLVRELQDYGIEVLVADPIADPDEVWSEYQLRLADLSSLTDLDALVVAVSHDEYAAIRLSALQGMFRSHQPVLVDVKGIFNKQDVERAHYLYWRL